MAFRRFARKPLETEMLYYFVDLPLPLSGVRDVMFLCLLSASLCATVRPSVMASYLTLSVACIDIQASAHTSAQAVPTTDMSAY